LNTRRPFATILTPVAGVASFTATSNSAAVIAALVTSSASTTVWLVPVERFAGGDDGAVESWVADALQRARVAHLGTVGADGAVRLVPICFAVVDGWVASVVDHKPKRRSQLRRLDDIDSVGSATVLVDHYDEDWSQLWWVRIHGRAVVHREPSDETAAVLVALAAKYSQYRQRPPTGAVYRIALDDVRSWRAVNE
jgi:PPOX class probable F420-dependent enzyme